MRVSPAWLALREATDAAARSVDLVAMVERRLGGVSPLVLHDLGCGSGSMARWLAAQLPGPQHWVLHDHDPDLLEIATADMVDKAADGAQVTVESRLGDITQLRAADLASATLVTSSAVLDLLTAAEVERILAATVGAGRPTLLALSVAGRVELSPADPLDDAVGAAFNDHQRRTVAGRRLLGPDAVPFVVASAKRIGAVAVVRPSPWRLGAENEELLAQWFDGWVGAACEQLPELEDPAVAYRRRRQAEMHDGRLRIVVHHDDMLLWPAEPEGGDGS